MTSTKVRFLSKGSLRWWFADRYFLVGGFKYYLCSPLFGAMIQFEYCFSNGVETTNQFWFHWVTRINKPTPLVQCHRKTRLGPRSPGTPKVPVTVVPGRGG